MKQNNFAILAVILTIYCSVTMAAKIPEEVKKATAFLFIKDKSKLKANGTAFFVGVKQSEPNVIRSYLVTAKHVIFDQTKQTLYSDIYLRLEKRAGGTKTIKISLQPDKTVFFPSDSSVDLAIIPFFPDITLYDFKIIPRELIADKQKFVELRISEGSEVFFTGLFTHHIGKDKNYPIVRFGRVALVTDEKVNWNGVQTSLYLIESGSYGGNSGAPVYFYLGPDREPGSLVLGPPELYLAGVMMGSFNDAKKVRQIETNSMAVSISNMGIAAVTPAHLLVELLNLVEAKLAKLG